MIESFSPVLPNVRRSIAPAVESRSIPESVAGKQVNIVAAEAACLRNSRRFMEHNIAQGAPIGSPANHRSSSAVPSLEKALIKRDDADLLRAVGHYHIPGALTFQPSTKRKNH